MVDERVVAMREELNLTNTEPDEEAYDENGVSKRQLQHEMDSARESISHTVSAIADNVTNQAQAIRDTVANKLDWREHARKHPAAVTAGAVGIGFLLGYTLIGSIGNGRTNGHTNGHALESEHEPMEIQQKPQRKQKSEGPGLFDKLKTTRGYQRLTSEASGLLDQFIDEAVNVGKTVLLPAAINKITETVRANFEAEPDKQANKKQTNADNHSSTTQTLS